MRKDKKANHQSDSDDDIQQKISVKELRDWLDNPLTQCYILQMKEDNDNINERFKSFEFNTPELLYKGNKLQGEKDKLLAQFIWFEILEASCNEESIYEWNKKFQKEFSELQHLSDSFQGFDTSRS